MKMTAKMTFCLSAAIAALVAGCEVAVTPGGAVVATAPVVEVAPPTYVWDGFEYVGEYNGGFVYLNPGGVWVTAPGFVLDRFHGYERVHPDWRRTAVRYDRGHRPNPRGGHEERKK